MEDKNKKQEPENQNPKLQEEQLGQVSGGAIKIRPHGGEPLNPGDNQL